jgi:hypothetical protein
MSDKEEYSYFDFVCERFNEVGFLGCCREIDEDITKEFPRGWPVTKRVAKAAAAIATTAFLLRFKWGKHIIKFTTVAKTAIEEPCTQRDDDIELKGCEEKPVKKKSTKKKPVNKKSTKKKPVKKNVKKKSTKKKPKVRTPKKIGKECSNCGGIVDLNYNTDRGCPECDWDGYIEWFDVYEEEIIP